MIEDRYVWTIVNRGYSTFLDEISKFDLKTKKLLYWDNQVGHTPGEAILCQAQRAWMKMMECC
jgi:torulene dioxygenase